MNFVIFEDSSAENFYPLSLTRPLWELRCGIFTFRERFELFVQNNFSAEETGELYYFTADNLAPLFRERLTGININDYSVFEKDEDIFFMNSLVFPEEMLSDTLAHSVLMQDDVPLVGRISPDRLTNESDSVQERIMQADADFLFDEDIRKANYIWDLIAMNSQMIREDFELVKKGRSNLDGVTYRGDETQLYIEEGVAIEPFVMIDATDGPVYIKKGTEIHSFTRIEGPCFISNDCLILGAKVREGCSLGPCSRIGGEIEETIVQGYSNKYHDGFIGHSYIGEWVNLGAITTNSDLKNNYSDVRIFLPPGKQTSGSNKMGSFIGDFTKTSIGTLLNTGSSVGTGAMLLHSGGLSPSHIPPFAWFMKGAVVDRDWLQEFIDTTEKMTQRRGVEFTDTFRDFLEDLFFRTENLRKREIYYGDKG